MSWTLKLSPTVWDLVITSEGRFQTVNGSEEVRQRVATALQHFKGEYFLNVPQGVPWYDDILGSKSNAFYINNILRQVIMQVPGVLRIVDLNSTYLPVQRHFSVSATILVKRGPGDLPDSIILNGLIIEV